MIAMRKLTFSGVARDRHGMPRPNHVYLLIAGQHGVAPISSTRVYPLSDDTLADPAEDHGPVDGTDVVALDATIKATTAMLSARHAGLTRSISDVC
jgi:hypothetical protein